jgi:hypothetical protein
VSTATTAEQKAKRNEYLKAYRAKNSTVLAARKKARYASNREAAVDYVKRNRERVLLSKSRTSARASGMEHNITLEDIVIPEFCPVLGIQLDRNAWGRAANLPSLDRVDSTKGYIKGNVRVISWKANNLKCDITAAEALAIANYIQSHLSGEPSDLGTDE